MIKRLILGALLVVSSTGTWATQSKMLNIEGSDTKIWRDESFAASAMRVCDLTLENWEYAEPGEKISTQSEFWDAKHVEITNGAHQIVNTPCLVRTQKEGTWAEAMDDLLRHPARLECTLFKSSTILSALLNYMGEETFERYVTYFKKKVAPKFGITEAELFHELGDYLMRDGEGLPQAGSTFYLTSCEFYSTFKPNGNDKGHNLVCVSSNPELFVGFSDLFKTGPKNRAKVLNELKAGFLSKDDVESQREMHGKIAISLLEDPLLFSKYCSQAQAKCPGPQFIDEKKLYEVVDLVKVPVKRQVVIEAPKAKSRKKAPAFAADEAASQKAFDELVAMSGGSSSSKKNGNGKRKKKNKKKGKK